MLNVYTFRPINNQGFKTASFLSILINFRLLFKYKTVFQMFYLIDLGHIQDPKNASTSHLWDIVDGCWATLMWKSAAILFVLAEPQHCVQIPRGWHQSLVSSQHYSSWRVLKTIHTKNIYIIMSTASTKVQPLVPSSTRCSFISEPCPYTWYIYYTQSGHSWVKYKQKAKTFLTILGTSAQPDENRENVDGETDEHPNVLKQKWNHNGEQARLSLTKKWARVTVR